MMALPVIRDKYAENMEADEARGEAKAKADAKAWYARKQRAEDNDEPFDEPPPWE